MSIDTTQVDRLIRAGESLVVEFKGEPRKALSDQEIYENVVCLANTEGGTLLLGVEDDGDVTGARPRHGATTDPDRLKATIRNNTVPSIETRVSLHTVKQKLVLAVEVVQHRDVCSTGSGKCLRRVMGTDGPQCVPFYPYEYAGRRSALGVIDYSAQLVEGAS